MIYVFYACTVQNSDSESYLSGDSIFYLDGSPSNQDFYGSGEYSTASEGPEPSQEIDTGITPVNQYEGTMIAIQSTATTDTTLPEANGEFIYDPNNSSINVKHSVLAECNTSLDVGSLQTEIHPMFGSMYFVTLDYEVGECRYDLQYKVEMEDYDVDNSSVIPLYVNQNRNWVAIR